MRLYLNVIIIVFIFVCKLFYKYNMTIQQHSCETVVWYNFDTKISEGKMWKKDEDVQSVWHYKNAFLDLISNLLNYNKYLNNTSAHKEN